MKTLVKLGQLVIVFSLLGSFVAPAVLMKTNEPARLHPQLAEIAALSPDESVRVLVQKAGATTEAERFVESNDGTVLKVLDLINAFAADMPAGAAANLATLDAVEWVSPDAKMMPAFASPQSVRDEFNSTSYTNNDGTTSWSTGWIETGDNGSPSGGDITVEVDECPDDDSRCIEFDADTGLNASIEREADLSGASVATLTFDYHLDSSTPIYVVEASGDAGYTWSVLETLNGEVNTSASLDLSPYTSDQTRIRFRLLTSGGWQHLYIDNVQITYHSSANFMMDRFDSTSYSNNDGTLSWSTEWIETGDNGSPSGGDITVEVDECPDHDSRCIEFDADAGFNNAIERETNLSGASAATLTFDYHLDDDDPVYFVEASDDGGATWNLLQVLTDKSNSSASLDLTPYLSAQTRVRFRLLSSGGWRHLYIDNVQILVEVVENTFLETLGVDQLHAEGIMGQGIGVAVIDSGMENHMDFAGRLTVPAGFNGTDLYGHGTHVAGILGGDGSASGGTYAGTAPGAQFISLGVTDAFGMAYESDVVAAMQWVFENQVIHNIRVVNLSLNSTMEDSYHNSAINAAAEILWLNGVVVVASAGNQAAGAGFNPAKAAPANDPFIIVVGASDELATPVRDDDILTTFSANGVTTDGYFRPDILAPGYDIYAALCQTCSWGVQYPERLGLNGHYIRLSGTSMAAPMVAGAVALLLSDEPGLTPDQVKYRLMNTGTSIGGTTYLDAYAAVHGSTTQSANQSIQMPHSLLAKMALMAYWTSVNGGDNIDWEHVDWSSVNWNSVNWNSVNWNSVNWNSVNWNSVNWNSVNWNSVNWNSVNWNSVNWNSVNWNSVNWNSMNMNSLIGENPGLGGLYWGDARTPVEGEPLPVRGKGEPVSPPETPGGSQTLEEKAAASVPGQ